jgi:hypothetical protein
MERFLFSPGRFASVNPSPLTSQSISAFVLRIGEKIFVPQHRGVGHGAGGVVAAGCSAISKERHSGQS